MKSEIEARLLEVDSAAFVAKVQAAGGEFVGDWLQIRYCYDFNPVRPNSWIRLRTNGQETTLTIKEIKNKKIDGTKESEIVVSSFEGCDEILNKLGYTARSKQENRRIRFMLKCVEIDIDMWPNIPDYVEFESPSKQHILDVCKLLGIDFKDLTTMDVESIYNHYGYSLSQMDVLVLEDDRKQKNLIKHTAKR